MKYKIILFFILGIDALILFFQTSELSISYHEASLLYGDFSFLQLIIKKSIFIFGQNDFALRLPMIFFHISSALLLYKISKKYIKNETNRIWLILVFVLLPGVISSALLVDSAGIIIFGLLLFIYLFQLYKEKFPIVLYLVLGTYVLIDSGFVYLFLALAFYALFQKEKYFFVFNTGMFLLSIYLYGFNTQGLPKGHFLDSIGIYSAIFTPIVFVYIFYILYRRLLTKELDLLWFIASTALIVSLLLSLRQRVEIEQFAPYLIVALPLGAQTFYSTYRVRLKRFRTKYRMLFSLTIAFLFLNTLLVLFNKYLYLVLDKPENHFAYKMHIAKELAHDLKEEKINCVSTKRDLAIRLKYYGIKKCKNNILWQGDKNYKKDIDVTIRYKNKPVYSAYVTKLNNK